MSRSCHHRASCRPPIVPLMPMPSTGPPPNLILPSDPYPCPLIPSPSSTVPLTLPFLSRAFAAGAHLSRLPRSLRPSCRRRPSHRVPLASRRAGPILSRARDPSSMPLSPPLVARLSLPTLPLRTHICSRPPTEVSTTVLLKHASLRQCRSLYTIAWGMSPDAPKDTASRSSPGDAGLDLRRR